MLRILTALLVSVLLTHGTWAEQPAPERLRQLMTFAAKEMGVEAAHVEIPQIIYHSPRKLLRRHVGIPDYIYLFLTSSEEEWNAYLYSMLGFYSSSANAIVLRDDTNYTNPENEYILVHELVHYLQRVYREWFVDPHRACLKQLERRAYEITNQWVKTTGHGHIYSDATILERSSCKN